jgi:hypothetical protein
VHALDEHELVPGSLLDEVCRQAAQRGAVRLAESLRAEVESYDYARARETAAAIGRLLASAAPGVSE